MRARPLLASVVAIELDTQLVTGKKTKIYKYHFTTNMKFYISDNSVNSCIYYGNVYIFIFCALGHLLSYKFNLAFAAYILKIVRKVGGFCGTFLCLNAGVYAKEQPIICLVSGVLWQDHTPLF